ncbi:MAG: hypothetical protein ABW221_16950 [Vicinamibacteria bacterium]
MKLFALPAALLALAACGGGSTPPVSPATPDAPPTVFGDYDVTVALQQNDCGSAVTVLPQPTVVRQTPGAGTFDLTHGGLALAGSVARDGVFTTTPLVVADPLGPATLTVAGRFSATGFEATVTVAVTGRCRYLVGWSGRNRSRANVLG